MLGFMKDLIRILRVALLHLIYNIYPSLSLPKRAVIVAPHPDDEVIGCGGLIQALVERGTPPHVIILTGGEGSHRGCCGISAEELIAGRHNLTIKAAETMGLPLSHIHCLQYPDGGVALEHPETERLAALLQELRPDAIFVPHHGEGWSDHVQAATIVAQITDCRLQITGGESVSQTENEERTVKGERLTLKGEIRKEKSERRKVNGTDPSVLRTPAPNLGEEFSKQRTVNGERLTLKESVLCTPSSVLSTENTKPELYSYCVWMWYYNVWDLRLKDGFLLRLTEKQHQLKQKAIREYLEPKAPCGKPWSGVLPAPFLKATEWNKELYFLVR